MRKWMRDKLKRRKKSPEETGTQPAPLQPAYFEPPPGAQEPEPRAEIEPSAPDASEPIESSPEPAPGNIADNLPTGTEAQSGGGLRRPRRRRGRGGRGRRRPAQAATAAAVPASEAVATPTQTAAQMVEVPAAPRASKGTVVLTIGLPGSGKSSWFKRNNITPLSSDMIRALLFDDPDEQRFQDLVFSNLRSMLRARLVARRPMNFVDATNLTPHDRHSWIKLAKDYGYEAQALYFDVPLEVCLERNQRRQRTVSEDIMRKMAAKLKAPTFDEGFAKITVVRVKQKE